MRCLRAAGIAVPLFALCGAVVSAHAYVVGAQPQMNAGYANPSGSVAISFDEPVDVLDANAIQVVDASGTRVDKQDASVDPQDATRVVVHVDSRLRPGIYTVHWRVVSADTHVVHGAYSIGVGVPGTQAPNEPDSQYEPSGPLASILRTMSLLGALVAAGAIFLRFLMFDRLASSYPGGLAAARAAVVAGSALILIVAAPSLLVQAAAAGGALGTDVEATLRHSLWGTAFLLRLASASGLLIAALLAWKRSRLAAIVFSIPLLATFCFTGHAVGVSSWFPHALAVGSDFVHIVAASAWIGGILVLLCALIGTRVRSGVSRAREVTWLLFVNFTPIAMASVCIIFATGVYACAIHVGTVGNMFATVYGRLVLAKLCAFLILLAFGYRHMRLGIGAASDSSRATLVYEGLIGFIVVALTGFLIGQTPPAGMAMPGSSVH
jgi:copper transport protein